MVIPTNLRWVFRQANKPVLWIGAGVSCQAEPSLPTLWKLVSTLKETLWPEGPEIVDPYAFIDTYLAQFKARGSLLSFLEAQIRPGSRSPQPGALHLALARLVADNAFAAVIDTNYDLVMRQALERISAAFLPSRLSAGLELPSDGTPRYWTLHGDHSEWIETVLDGNSYATFAERHPLAINQLQMFLRQRPVLFVGCSMQDPRILDWLWNLDDKARQNLHGLVAALGDDAYVQLRTKAENDPKYDRLLQQLVVAELPNYSALPAWFSAIADEHMPKPSHARTQIFVGREAEYDYLCQRVLGADCRVAVLGTPGIGKSTLARQVFTDSKVVGHFRSRRVFVRLSDVETGDEMLAKVALAMGAGLSGNPQQQAAEVIGQLLQGPALLIVDNLETVWHRDAERVEALLNTWNEIKNLALIATIRGRQWPSGALRETVRLHQLSLEEARCLFLAHAPEYAHEGAKLDAFLAALDGIPLVLELLAKQAQSLTLDVLRLAWQSRRNEMIPEWSTALKVSYASPRMTNEARELVGIAAEFPNGLAQDDFEATLGANWIRGLVPATGLSLVHERDCRLLMHALVRDFVKREQPASNEGLIRARNHYIRRATEWGALIATSNGAEATTRLTAELDNVRCALLESLKNDDASEAIDASIALGSYAKATGASVEQILKLATDRALQSKDMLRAAHGFYCQGDIALHRGDHKTAEENYSRALTGYCGAACIDGQGNCIYGMGRIAEYRGDHEQAHEHYERASSIYEVSGNALGIANCSMSLGDLAIYQKDYRAASERLQHAFGIYKSIGVVLGQANCIKILGELAFYERKKRLARARFAQALPMFEAAGVVVGQAGCFGGLGDVAMSEGNLGNACACYERGRSLFESIGDIVGQANCIRGLGEVALKQGAAESAYNHFVHARDLYQHTPRRSELGWTLMRLANLSQNKTEREALLTRAYSIWRHLGRQDLIDLAMSLGPTDQG